MTEIKKTFLFTFLFCLLSFYLIPHTLEAKKKEDKPTAKLFAPAPNQPYVHQWFETKTKKGTSVVGQAYRPRKDLVVLEMAPLSEKGEPVEIQSVRLITQGGKVYEGKIRRLPSGFMPTARQNYQNPQGEAPSPEYSIPRSE